MVLINEVKQNSTYAYQNHELYDKGVCDRDNCLVKEKTKDILLFLGDQKNEAKKVAAQVYKFYFEKLTY